MSFDQSKMTVTNKVGLFFKFVASYWKSMVLIGVPILFLPLVGSNNKPMQCAYVVIIVAIFWITEVLNLAVTSLIPIILFPTFGILTPSAVASCYMKEITLMLIGGLIVAKTIEKQNLHKRLALRILKIMGPNPIFQYMGFMLSTWILSMWISNTATTAMMITLASAVVEQRQTIGTQTAEELEMGNVNLGNNVETLKTDPNDYETMAIYKSTQILINKGSKEINEISRQNKNQNFEKGLFLAIAYSATCGGIASLPGTAPNLVFFSFMKDRYQDTMKLNFGSFMLFGVPLSVIIVSFTWLLLCARYLGFRAIFKRKKDTAGDQKLMALLDEEIKKLGSISFGEISTLVVFCVLVLLWVLRDPGVPLLARLFTYKNANGKNVEYWSDAVSAILATLFVFILPAKNPFKIKSDEKLMDWKSIENGFSWGLVFLFGGGFALAAGCEKSGLSEIIGNVLVNLKHLPHFSIILVVSLGISFLTEITSNTATVTLLLPIMLKMAECINMHPMKMGLSVAIACSFSFCLPAATPPNAIVFSTGRVRVLDMASSGFALNTFCTIVLSFMAYYYTVPIFNTDVFPAWINANCSNF